MNIYVGNLTYEASEADVRQVFETFGEVTSVKIITDKYTGQSRGIGFVEMANKKDALTAISDLNGKELKGRALKVNEAQPKKTYDNNGGGNGGGGNRSFGGGNGGGGGNRGGGGGRDRDRQRRSW